MLKLKRTSTNVMFAVLGAVYLTAFSNLEINLFFKGYAAIIPVQILALIYGVYLIYTNKQKSSRTFKSNNP